ncbi:MAG: Hsp20/alpha crystallin family protein [Polyangiales bacterium]
MNTQQGMTKGASSQFSRRSDGSVERVQERALVAPAVDIFENKDELLLVADLAGVKKEDVTVRLENDELTLEARRYEEGLGNSLATEYRVADYRRAFAVPQVIDASKISAELKHGVLSMHLPKSDSVKPRRIEIKAG